MCIRDRARPASRVPARPWSARRRRPTPGCGGARPSRTSHGHHRTPMRTRARVILLALALACALVVVAGYLVGPAVGRLMHPTPTATPTSSQERDASVQALSSLETVTVRARTKVAGYDRSCSLGHGCVFGPAWSDDTTAAGGHNGCDTRNDVLAGQLQDV